MLAPEHGKEVARYVKPGQTIHIFSDGCLIVHLAYPYQRELVYVMLEDLKEFKGHTDPEFCDSPDVRARLLRCQYQEEDPLFWL